MCRDSRGVLDSHERKSLHFSDNSNGVNAEHCRCGELLHNGVASDFCISVTCSYSCRPIPWFVPLALGPVVPYPCHRLSYEKLCTGHLVCSVAGVFNRCILPDSNFT